MDGWWDKLKKPLSWAEAQIHLARVMYGLKPVPFKLAFGCETGVI